MGKRSHSKWHIEKAKATSRETCHYLSTYNDQLKVELRKKDPKTFQKVRSSFWKQHTWNRKPSDPSLKLAATLRHMDIFLCCNILQLVLFL